MELILRKEFNSQSELEKFADRVSKQIFVGDVIRLEGDLGVGKSVFARTIIRGLGSKRKHITSPTFTITQPYDDTRIPVLHVDCYRLADPEEVEFLEPTHWFSHGLVIVEWPDRGGDWFRPDKPDTLDYHIASMDNGSTLTVKLRDLGDEKREIEFYGGLSWKNRFATIEKSLCRPQNEKERDRYLAKFKLRGHVLTPVCGDNWSTRSYWRLQTTEGPRILMDAIPQVENIQQVIELTQFLEGIGIKVPHIYESDVEAGYIMMEDFGRAPLIDYLQAHPEQIEPWYEIIIDLLLHIYRSRKPALRNYTRKDLWIEVTRFTDYYLPAVTGHATHTADRRAYLNAWESVFDKILDVPQTMVHWDFHAANIMKLTEEPEGLHSLGLLDFQDARIGPITYDIATILKNDRLPISQEMEDRLLQRFLDGLGSDVSKEDFMASYHAIILQRTLKIIGGITKLVVRDNRCDLVDLLPRCWELVDSALSEPVCAEVRRFFLSNVSADRTLLKDKYVA